MTIHELQRTVDEWIRQYGVRYFNELTNVALLMEEVGEFARLTARTYGEQSFKAGTRPADIHDALADEMSDVLFVLICLANQMDIDLEEAFRRNLDKKTNRDADRHRSNPTIQE